MHGTGTTALLRQVAAVGPYFAVRAGAPAEGAPDGFRPLRALYATGPGSVLAERLAVVAERLGTDEPRVAASIVHLGLAARFWSVALAAAALGGAVVDLHPDRAHWRLTPQGPLDLWLPHGEQPVAHGEPPAGLPALGGPATDGRAADLPALGAALHRAVVLDVLTPLLVATRCATPVAERLLWGNAASALVGALRTLHGHLAPERPNAARTARALALDLLTRRPLDGTGTLRAPGPQAPPSLRRTSCCLYYRTPGGGVCGDCVFTEPPRTEPRRPARTPRRRDQGVTPPAP